MVPFNLTPAPSIPIPFVSACRLWRRGLKWWLLISIVMQALLLLATCIPGKLDEVSSQDELKQCLRGVPGTPYLTLDAGGVLAGLVSHHGSIGACDSSWHAPPCHPAGKSQTADVLR
jgi:hypothetical protein